MFGWFSKEKTQNWRKELKTQGKNSKLKEKTQNSGGKLNNSRDKLKDLTKLVKFGQNLAILPQKYIPKIFS